MKKEYIKPEIKVYDLEPENFLIGTSHCLNYECQILLLCVDIKNDELSCAFGYAYEEYEKYKDELQILCQWLVNQYSAGYYCCLVTDMEEIPFIIYECEYNKQQVNKTNKLYKENKQIIDKLYYGDYPHLKYDDTWLEDEVKYCRIARAALDEQWADDLDHSIIKLIKLLKYNTKNRENV